MLHFIGVCILCYIGFRLVVGLCRAICEFFEDLGKLPSWVWFALIPIVYGLAIIGAFA